MPRKLDEILSEAEAWAVAEAEKLIKPRKDDVEAFRAQLTADREPTAARRDEGARGCLYKRAEEGQKGGWRREVIFPV
jgi:hypothetical protein